jgi:hypothetical protein
VVTVIVATTAVPAGVTVVGAKAHVVSAGKPLHAKETI